MIHVLVVGPSEKSGRLPQDLSSVEVLHAHGADEAVEKLARNRRIDAVLLLSGEDNASVALAIREEVVAPPPLFSPTAGAALEGVRRLEGKDSELLDLLAEALNAGRGEPAR